MSVLTDMGFSEVVGHATEHYPFRVSESVKKTDDWFSGDAKVYSCGKYDVIPRLVDLQVFNEWLKDIGTERVSIPNAVAFDWNKIVKEQASKFLDLMRLIEGAGGTEFSHPLWFGAPVLRDRIEMVDYDGVSEYSQPAGAGEAEWWDKGWYLDGGATSTLEDLYFGPTRVEGMTDRMWAFSESYYTRAVQAVKESMIGNDPTYFRVPFNSKELASYCKDGMIHPPHSFLRYFYKGGKFENGKWKDAEDAALKPKAESPIVKFHDVVFPYILSDSVCSCSDPITVNVGYPAESDMFLVYDIHSVNGKDFSTPVADDNIIPIQSPYWFYPSCHGYFSSDSPPLNSDDIIAGISTTEISGYSYDGNGVVGPAVKDVAQTYRGKLAQRDSGYRTIYDYLTSWKAKYKDVKVCDFLGASSGTFEFPYDKNRLVFTVTALVHVSYYTRLKVWYLDNEGRRLGVAESFGGEVDGYPYFCSFGGSSWADFRPADPVRYKSYQKAFSFQVSSGVTCGTIVDIVNNGPTTPYVKYVGHRDDYLTNPPKATNLTDLSSQVSGSTIGNCYIDFSDNHLRVNFCIKLGMTFDGITSDLNYAKMPIGVYKYNWRNYVK